MLLKVRSIEDGMGRWRVALRLVGVGWYVGICIILGLVVGRWLDSKLDTSLLWIIGLIFGIFIAFYGVYRMLLPFTSNKRDKELG
jgi:F0F1-type ATP synthase assembly protein I